MTVKTTFNKRVSSLIEHVAVIEGRYYFIPRVYKKVSLGHKIIRSAKAHAKYLNSIITLYDIEKVDLEEGFQLIFSDDILDEGTASADFDQEEDSVHLPYMRGDFPLTKGGHTKFIFTWDGVEMWLSSRVAQVVAAGGTDAFFTLFGDIASDTVVDALISGVMAHNEKVRSHRPYSPMVYRFRSILYDQHTYQTVAGGRGPWMIMR